MKIMISKLDGLWKHKGQYIRENDSGFWCYFENNPSIPFKFPWKLYTYKKLEEK